MSIVKTRKQGDAVTVTIPKSLDVSVGVELEPMLTDEGILLRFVKQTKKDDFDEYILRDLFKEGYQGEDLIAEFERRKSNIPKALYKIADETKNEAAISREELMREVDL
ncbi:MAG: toxin-antitoxin system [Lactobacillales bacterium]|jgi:hypothetical protein|nr:toxin-antitoxin system [Lactobacillales bacterium]